MRSLSKILLPVDFSERSVGAARYARSLAIHFHAELTLLHVLTPPQYEFGALDVSGSMLADLYRDRSKLAAQELDQFLATELSAVDVCRVVLEGDPAPKIVEYAHHQPADIIIMPTHGYGPFRRFILGSNTAKVLHDADCPVWTGVHLEEAPAVAAIPFHTVLCAVDLGGQSAKTVSWAAFLAKEFGARLILMHTTACPPEAAEAAGPGWADGGRKAAAAELQRLLESVEAKAEILVEAGEPAKSICSAAARVSADALVIARGSASGVFGRLRTNAYAIIRQSPCPVVSV